jgi:hypothetical protein
MTTSSTTSNQLDSGGDILVTGPDGPWRSQTQSQSAITRAARRPAVLDCSGRAALLRVTSRCGPIGRTRGGRRGRRDARPSLVRSGQASHDVAGGRRKATVSIAAPAAAGRESRAALWRGSIVGASGHRERWRPARRGTPSRDSRGGTAGGEVAVSAQRVPIDRGSDRRAGGEGGSCGHPSRFRSPRPRRGRQSAPRPPLPRRGAACQRASTRRKTGNRLPASGGRLRRRERVRRERGRPARERAEEDAGGARAGE